MKKTRVSKQVQKALVNKQAVLNDSRDMGQQLPIAPEQVLGPHSNKGYEDITDVYTQ